MLRADMNRVVNYIKHTRRVLQLNAAVNCLPRGFLNMDAAGFSASGYAFANGAHVDTIMGLPVLRSAALADNHIDYLDPPGTTTIHSTLLITGAGAGAFTAVDQTYTEAGACGVFSAGGGELINVTESTSNNGTFLSTSATANTLVLSALPGESSAIVDEAAITGAVFI